MIQDYVRAKTKDDVVAFVKKGYTILGGGTYLSQHQDQIISLIDIQNIGNNKILLEDQIIIESGATFSEIVKSPYVPASFKEVVHQELRPNHLNTATIVGYICVDNRFSNILAWLNCAQSEILFYPNEFEESQDFESFVLQRPKGKFIEKISIPNETSIRWRMISRTPDDFPLISLFMNTTEHYQRITILGFSDKLITITSELNTNTLHETLNYLKNSRSQYSNQYISYEYFFEMTKELLSDMISKEE